MSLVVLEDLTLHFGSKTIVRDLSMRIGAHERIGLIGPNGSGKTTLLRILAGEQDIDRGSFHVARGVRIAYLPQELAVEGGRSLSRLLWEAVPGREKVAADLLRAEEELAECNTRVEAGDRDGEERLLELAQEVSALHEQMDHFERFFSEHEAARILAGLGFAASDMQRDVAEFSGGWKMRAVLAALLFQRPDLLLLDEPTNHLDLASVAWLGDFLQRSKIAFVLISHDREFLDELCERIVSFEPEAVRHYKGNFTRYLQLRKEEEVVLAAKAKNLQREREQAEAFIERFRAQATKAKAVQSRIKALERMDEVVVHEQRDVMDFEFAPTVRAAAQVMKIEGLAKSFGEVRLFSGVDLSVMRGDRIGIIGVNGAGKTTLLKILAGELAATAGSISLGAHVTVGYYAQHQSESLTASNTIFQELAARDPAASQTRVRALAGAFLFRGDDVEKRISVLSGGERSRVALAGLLLKPGNLMLMDEPTNHLDIASSEALAESLAKFDGTLLFVSHNRAFVRRLATKIWNVADGTVEVYPGTLDDYMERARRRDQADDTSTSMADPNQLRVRGGASGASHTTPNASPARSANASSSATKTTAATVRPSAEGNNRSDRPAPTLSAEEAKAKRREEARLREEKGRVLGPLRKALDAVEAQVAELERQAKALNQSLADPELYDNPRRRDEILAQHRAVHAQLEQATQDWERAAAEHEAAAAKYAM